VGRGERGGGRLERKKKKMGFLTGLPKSLNGLIDDLALPTGEQGTTAISLDTLGAKGVF